MLGSGAEVLMRFRAVDSIKTDFVLGTVLENGDGVAVCDGDDFAGDNGIGVGKCGGEKDCDSRGEENGVYYGDEEAFEH